VLSVFLSNEVMS